MIAWWFGFWPDANTHLIASIVGFVTFVIYASASLGINLTINPSKNSVSESLVFYAFGVGFFLLGWYAMVVTLIIVGIIFVLTILELFGISRS